MTFNDALKKWNGGILHGAQTPFAKAIGVASNTVSQWANGKLRPGEAVAQKIAREFDMTVEEVMALFPPRGAAPAGGVVMDAPLWEVPMTPVLNYVSAARFNVAFDAPPIDMIPNPAPGRRLFALRISGDCMEPMLRNGEDIYIDPDAVPVDKKVVLVQSDGEYTLKRYSVIDGVPYLVPDNAKYPRIRVQTNKTLIRGVVIGKFQRDI